MLEIDPVEPQDQQAPKPRRKYLAFVLPLAIQTFLTLIHLDRGFGLNVVPLILYKLFVVATFAYTIFIFLIAVLSGTSMTMESVSAEIRRENKTELQWFRHYFKIVRKYIPAYNTSFATNAKKAAGAFSSAIYVFALVANGFVGNAITVLFSVCLIWFGIWMVKDCYEMVAEAKRKEEARKAREKKAREDLSDVSRAYGERI